MRRHRFGACVAAVAACLIVARHSAADRFIPVAGGAFTVALDPTGHVAYLSNRTRVMVFDLPSRRVLQEFPVTSEYGVVAGPIDASGRLLTVFDFNEAGTVDLVTGVHQRLLVRPGVAYSAAVVAGEELYAAAFNAREVHVTPLAGSTGTPAVVDPYPNAPEPEVLVPCELAASPDGGTVLIGDQNHDAVHVVRTADHSVIATHPVGHNPCRLLFLDATTTIAVDAGNEWSESDGEFSVVDLDGPPTGVPTARRIPRLRQLQNAALDAGGTSLVLLYGGQPSDPEGGTSTPPRVGVVNPLTGRVRARRRLPRKRGFASGVAITPDGRTILVGTAYGLQLFRLDGSR